MSNLPKSIRRKIRDDVLARLTADGWDGRRYFRTWQLYQGAKAELAEWTEAMLPAIRCGWDGGPMAWSAQAQHKAELHLAITIGVKGTDEGDLMDAWEAVERRLFPPNDRTFADSLQPFGVYSLAIADPAISHDEVSAGALAMKATAKVVVRFHLNT